MSIKLALTIRGQLYRSTNPVRLLAGPIIPALLLSAAPAAQAVDYTWQGGTGDWNSATWSLVGFPDTTTSNNVFIDGGNVLDSLVSLNANASIGLLLIDAGDGLGLNNGKRLTVNGGTVTNNGALSLNSSFVTIQTPHAEIGNFPEKTLQAIDNWFRDCENCKNLEGG